MPHSPIQKILGAGGQGGGRRWLCRIVALLLLSLGVASTGSSPDVSVVVIHRRSALHLRVCLGALMKHLPSDLASSSLSWEVLVVETAGAGQGTSRRDVLLATVAEFSEARAVINRMGADLNASAALNEGWQEARGWMVSWVDDSVEVRAGLMGAMLGEASGAGVGVVGAEVRRPDGMLFHSEVGFDFGRRERQTWQERQSRRRGGGAGGRCAAGTTLSPWIPTSPPSSGGGGTWGALSRCLQRLLRTRTHGKAPTYPARYLFHMH